MVPDILSPPQAHALFDILSHHEAYEELRDLRSPGALAHSGPPFKTNGAQNQSPLCHALFSEFIVPLPGLRDVSPDFYQEKCQGIIEEFAKADLSESYEAGYIGIRKTLATAMAALIEAPARGLFGGFPKRELSRTDGEYDRTKPEDVVAAFHDFLQGLVYGNTLDELFAKGAETDDLSQHEPIIQAAHEYILVILASFMHYILIITPEGQTMLTMIKQANSLIPYTAIRQTLKIGNAATMINAMMKLMLTKMTINSVTSFLGLTNSSDAGWNLLQTVIWTVVNWDTNTLQKRIAEIEKSSNGPSKAQRELLKSYVEKEREEHDKCRKMSEAKAEPIVVTIMEEYEVEALSDAQIPLTLDYLSLQVSLADRKKIVDILCSHQPDLLTQAVREAVAAYDPVIRALHNAVDLSSTVSDLQSFLDDLLTFASSSGKPAQPASVWEFVSLLRKHQRSFHRFTHQLLKNGPEVSQWYKDYAKASAANFKMSDPEVSKEGPTERGAGKLTETLNKAVSQLSQKQQNQVKEECDAYADYISNLLNSSESSMKFDHEELPIKKSKRLATSRPTSRPTTRESSPSRSKPAPGPGMFLRRWQAYVNETKITPAKPDGPLRYGGDADIVTAGRVPTSGATKSAQATAVKGEDARPVPSCAKTVEYLGNRFKAILRESRYTPSPDDLD